MTYACSGSESGEKPEDKKPFTGADKEVKLMTVDPGHFHAGLVQKYGYDQVDSVAYVYAPEGSDGLERHLDRIEQYNSRQENPTNWVEKVYTGPDFFEKMIQEQPGNVVVLAGNNAQKTSYIKQSVDAGLNVLADKPMVIKPEDFPMLREALAQAQEDGILLYDIMTERFEITTLLQRRLSMNADVFGSIVEGTPENPAITKESVHHFFKYVSGQPLTRPGWFFDVDQQGEAIVDVSTHLVDLILWETFPGQGIDTTDVQVVQADRWATEMTPTEFQKVTRMESYPDYLKEDLDDENNLNVFANGSFVFQVNGVHGKVSVEWNYQAPEGTGDTHYSIMRGSKANLVIRQGEEQNYVPTLYVEPLDGNGGEAYEETLKKAIDDIARDYSGVSLTTAPGGWQVVIPEKHRVGHEAHFAQVTRQYLQYLADGEIPGWERKNMLTKYYLTMQAYAKSR
ncbi:Putative oxidoreductase C terminal domain-containing protein [Fodinibius sediminis]|uniref:Oxidoreductase C terminal domain-containing protein n=2 Tax=Fodinibius sediminis TaxID=1214077 RepID=A0A521B1X9_9BACT|nr:Putative oxidoreductase C terminal domain-containing protein [Fodinibius sediminis]